MNAKTLIRNVLLLLALGGVVFVLGQEILARRAVGGGGAAIVAEAPFPAAAKLVVYYFSTGKECSTCEQIPAYAKDTLETHFARELAAGELVWRVVDVDLPANEHFIADYKIYTKSVVLQKLDHGKPGPWENLDKVWDLVYDKAAFEAYVQAAMRKMLDGAA